MSLRSFYLEKQLAMEKLGEHQIQWYPGHIAKHERELGNQLKLVDVVVEVLDARLPSTTTNKRLEAKIRTRPTVVVLNKADLADEQVTSRWRQHLKKSASKVILYETKTPRYQKNLLNAILEAGEEKLKQLEAKGLKRRPLRVLVVGMPNVGKSSLINHIVGKKKTKTGHKAGVTRTHQWVRIHPGIELLDSPGIIPPSLESNDAGNLLAIVSSIGEAAFDDEEVAKFLLNRLEALYPKKLAECYKLSAEIETNLASIASARNFQTLGAEPDTLRAAQTLLAEFRHGKLGKLSLECPELTIEKAAASPNDEITAE